MTETSLAFAHRFEPSPTPSAGGSDLTFVLLHGTGGNENSLMTFARDIAPGCAMLAARGRSLEEGFPRWFRRTTAITFDQQQIVSEAAAFADFMTEAAKAYPFDPAKAVCLGYSNGANMIGALMLLHPGIVRRAVLLRAMHVLETMPEANLSGASVLMATGARDPYNPYATALESSLMTAGATVENVLINAGHDLTLQDIALIKPWLAGKVPGKAMA